MTTYPGEDSGTLVKCSNDGDTETMIGKRRDCVVTAALLSKRRTDNLTTPHAQTVALCSPGRTYPEFPEDFFQHQSMLTPSRILALGLSVSTLAVAAPAALRAQSELASLSGIVVDSVHNAPLDQAEVRIAALGLKTRTNENGRFELTGIRPGTYRVDVVHPLITSLGLAVGADAVRLDSAQHPTAAFAIPSAGSIRKMVCGPSDSHSAARGVLVGVVANAGDHRPVEGATVSLSWLEVSFRRGAGLTTDQRIQQTHSGPGGFYSFCNLDDSLEALVSADVGPRATTDVRVSLESQQIATRTLLLPDARTVASPRSLLRGRVSTSGGQAVAGARVEMMGFADSARTRADGSFELALPPIGTQTLRVRSLGYDEYTAPIDVTPTDTTIVAVRLARSPPSLETVFIRAKISDVAERSGFQTRALVGPGHYVTAADITRRKAPCLLDNVEWVTGFYVTNRRACYGDIYVRSGDRGLSRLPPTSVSAATGDPSARNAASLNRAAAIAQADFTKDPSCVKIFIDDIQESGSDALAALPPRDVVGMELYQPVTAPARYSGGNCAVIVVWTTRYQGTRH